MPGSLTNTLSINVEEEEVTLVGCSMVGLNEKELIVSKKDNVSLWLSVFSKSAFQSPEMKQGLFIFDNCTIILVKKPSVKELSSVDGCYKLFLLLYFSFSFYFEFQ